MASTPLTAVALNGPIDPALVAERVAWPEVRRYPYGIAMTAPEGTLVYVFKFGAVVMLGREGLDASLQSTIEAVSGRRTLDDTVDVWMVDVDPDIPKARARVGWDRIILPGLTPQLAASTALLLGQSAALERYEHAANLLVEDARELSKDLVKRGMPPRRVRDLVRQVGRVNRDRLAMVSDMYVLDRPEETWEDPQLSALYDALRDGLELPQRHESVQLKLEAVESTMRMVVDLWNGRLAHLLEWAIVWLIVFEVIMGLLEHAFS